MKKNRFLLIFSTLLIASALLSACTGSGSVTNSWPGLTVAEGVAYLAYNQHVFAINLDNGAEAWRFPVEADNKLTFYTDPVLFDDEQVLVPSYNSTLYNLNAANGQQIWAFDEANDRYVASPLATPGAIYAPSSDEYIYAVGSNGSKLWKFKSGHDLWATPATNGEAIFLPAMDHHLYALDPSTGQVIWDSGDLGGSIVGTPAIDEQSNRLFVGTFGREILAVDTTTGQVANRYATQGWVWSGPVLRDGRLYFGDMDGYLYALNAQDLTPAWEPVKLDSAARPGIPGQPLVMDDAIYFGTISGNLFAADPSTGNQLWTKTIGGKLYSGPKLAGELILLTPVGLDQQLLALDLNGNQQWAFTPEK